MSSLFNFQIMWSIVTPYLSKSFHVRVERCTSSVLCVLRETQRVHTKHPKVVQILALVCVFIQSLSSPFQQNTTEILVIMAAPGSQRSLFSGIMGASTARSQQPKLTKQQTLRLIFLLAGASLSVIVLTTLYVYANRRLLKRYRQGVEGSGEAKTMMHRKWPT